MLSKRIYDRLPVNPILEESRQVITSASGSRLCQYGKADFVIEIERSRETVKIMVADISVDGILGLDFLKAYKGDINFERSSLKLNNEDCRFPREGTLGCYRVTADNDVCRPPRSGVVIQVKVPGENAFGSADYLVEAEPKFLESGRALVGRTLVKGHNILPVCLMNITESVQQIHDGTLIAKMSALEEQNVSSGEADNLHLIRCGSKCRQKRVECNQCDFPTNKKSDMQRHERTRHGGISGTVQADSESDHEWESLDPGSLFCVVGESDILQRGNPLDHFQFMFLEQRP